MATTALILLAATAPVSRACDPGVELLITEFMALNTSTRADENDEYSDWIEITIPVSRASTSEAGTSPTRPRT